jgi:hypothetical protein
MACYKDSYTFNLHIKKFTTFLQQSMYKYVNMFKYGWVIVTDSDKLLSHMTGKTVSLYCADIFGEFQHLLLFQPRK